MVSVTYYNRKPRKTGFSIEGIFELVKNSLRNDIDIHDYNYDVNLSRWGNIRKARTYARDVNHITGDIHFIAIGLKKFKTVLTIHDFGHYENMSDPWRRLMFKWFWYILPLRNCDIVTVVSNFTRNKLIDHLHFPEERIRLVHNPIKPVFKFAGTKARGHDRLRVLQIGSGKHKNLSNLIAAVNGLDVHIDIVGWPTDDEIAQMNAQKTSYTLFNSLTDEGVYERYKACDLLYFASYHEGFGMPIIEAQCIGRPVITSNIGAMKEVAKDSALLVDPYQPDDIRHALIQLRDHATLYEQMVAAGIENSKGFEGDKIARDYLKIYNELA
jgi:glycosyltransferase involved in cell wall biosynthesis